jgi:hypothetical protein
MIFCKPRHVYDSYTDFWTLVDLCGYESIYIDELKVKAVDETYIVVTPDINHEWKKPKARIIFWLLEWYGDYEAPPGTAETWVSNQTFAEMKGLRFVPVGSHEGLGEARNGDTYDIAHMSYDGIHRRNRLFGKLRGRGVSIAPNGWGDTRHITLMNTRAMLHIHQQAEYPAIAPLRASLAAAYHMPFISENGWSIEPYNDTIITHDYETMDDAIPAILEGADLPLYAEAFHQKLCHELRFDKVVEASL